MANAFVDWLKRILFGRSRTPPGVSPFAPGTGPSKLLILRHAEKTGDQRDPHLSRRGKRRSEKLAHYIPEQFGKPDFLVAAKSSERSERPVETVEPLADTFDIDIVDWFDDDDVDDAIAYLGKTPRYAEKFGVISWRHSELPDLIAALGAPEGTYPNEWDERVFNRMIEISFRDGAPPHVRQIKMPF